MPELQEGMQYALLEARYSAEQNEVPIGAALLYQGQLIASAGNSCFKEEHPLKHAEFKVLNLAAQKLSQQEFRQAKLFVTLEPCPMCMGAIMHMHLGHLIFGAYNLKWGACGTVINLLEAFPSEPIMVYGGICEVECSTLLESFFSKLREKI